MPFAGGKRAEVAWSLPGRQPEPEQCRSVVSLRICVPPTLVYSLYRKIVSSLTRTTVKNVFDFSKVGALWEGRSVV